MLRRRGIHLDAARSIFEFRFRNVLRLRVGCFVFCVFVRSHSVVVGDMFPPEWDDENADDEDR